MSTDFYPPYPTCEAMCAEYPSGRTPLERLRVNSHAVRQYEIKKAKIPRESAVFKGDPASYSLLFYFSTKVFNSLWKPHTRLLDTCRVTVETHPETQKYTGISYTFPLWTTANRTFPHDQRKGCGKPVGSFGRTEIHSSIPQHVDFSAACGKQEILYNSGVWPERGYSRRSGVWIKDANPQVSGRISKNVLWHPIEKEPFVPGTVLVKISCAGAG